jgi:hypothetical protein
MLSAASFSQFGHLGKLADLYKSEGYEMTCVTMSRLINMMAQRKQNNSSTLRYYYRQYMKRRKEDPEKWPLNSKTMNLLQNAYCKGSFSDFDWFGTVLEDFHKYGKALNGRALSAILEVALRNGDVDVLDALLGTNLTRLLEEPKLTDAYFNHGRISRLLEIASTAGRPDMARIGMEWAKILDIEVDTRDYALWCAACLNKNDFRDAIEVMIFAAKNDVDLKNSVYGPWLQKLFSFQMCKATGWGDNNDKSRVLDDVYFGLLDLARSDWLVPAIAINAVISAAGILRDVDRSFACFEEYEELFGLTKDIDAYNALLRAASAQSNQSMQYIMAILGEMENEGVEPDSTSYSHLFHGIASTVSSNGVNMKSIEIDSIVNLVQDRNILPDTYALTTLMKALLREDCPVGDTKELIEKIQLMMEHERGSVVPGIFPPTDDQKFVDFQYMSHKHLR